jgi:hypothetical protein
MRCDQASVHLKYSTDLAVFNQYRSNWIRLSNETTPEPVLQTAQSPDQPVPLIDFLFVFKMAGGTTSVKNAHRHHLVDPVGNYHSKY